MILLCLIPAVALGRGSVGGGRGTGGSVRGGTHVRAGGGGLSLSYSKKTSNSSLSIRYSSGLGGYRSSCYGTGYSGSATQRGSASVGMLHGRPAYPSHPIHRPPRPAHPIYRPYPGGRFGPYEYVEGVYFVGTPGVQVFPGPGAALPGVPAAAPAKYAHLSADQAVDAGDALFARGDYGEAVTVYRAAVQRALDDPMAVFALGHGLFAVGVLDEAAAMLRKGVLLHPDIVRVHMRRRDFYGRPADYDEQMAMLLRHAATRPDDRDTTFLLGYNLYYSEDRRLAKAQFTRLGAGDEAAQLFLRSLEAGE